MKSQRLIPLVLLLSTIFTLTACFNSSNPEGNWALTTIKTESATLSTDNQTLWDGVTMLIAKSTDGYTISGFSGVNNFTGSIEIDNNIATISPLAVTMMLGPKEQQQTEDLFIRTLQSGGVLEVTTHNGQTHLILHNNENKTTITFKPSTLENTEWTLFMYNNGNATTTPPQGLQPITIGFSNEGKVYGSTGVNQLTGTYEASKNELITFSPIGTTRMAAPNQEARDFEAHVIELFEQVDSYQMDGKTLTFRDKNNTNLLIYSR